MVESPLVSVIVPCYNCELFVGEALRSVLNQTMSNLELLVVDDCSTDGTALVVESLAKCALAFAL